MNAPGLSCVCGPAHLLQSSSTKVTFLYIHAPRMPAFGNVPGVNPRILVQPRYYCYKLSPASFSSPNFEFQMYDEMWNGHV
ncbi:hypothetical protein METBIDRAFT_118101 [Metschnikowia bicuspidata var. bicuspidata NRRL YB-4993]|uniref:Uncharacterized protein n=1 Tax=Metschnikowia bicuspidata var. bicuspidata NRRL YB-4993 TaxID=869754 RepID=A0A1A0HJX9_9ASCO|nr:hypothetical protein METBIDRAFT_118101 [Metschnikowia bicuspidata var. bicuspidata NRRL YB-4993]OBA24118.1 hypothetical protein METBIDRAFT_118101 [Metschnikowia bicuspidata var. bicuspidata NRRL YB-4993]